MDFPEGALFQFHPAASLQTQWKKFSGNCLLLLHLKCCKLYYQAQARQWGWIWVFMPRYLLWFMWHWSSLYNRVNVRVIYPPWHGLVLHCFCIHYFISSMCSPLSTLNILCRSSAMQGAYMCAVLSWSLSSFPFSALFFLQSSSFPSHFSFPGERQDDVDDDDDASSANGPCWDSDFGCKGDFTGTLHFTYQPSSVKKGKEGSHTSSDLTFFLGPLLKLFMPWQYL